ncbi:MAG: hypothetical protein AAF558_05100 [Verrucomicrobiota bacterium]
MPQTLDVITVADFREPQRCLFTWRSLFFLASWLYSRNRENGHSLHFVCIGDPPKSILNLAEKAGALVTEAEPQGILSKSDCAGTNPLEKKLLPKMDNKFRGLEVQSQHASFLLVDVDVFFNRPLSGAILQPNFTAAAPAHNPHFSESVWKSIYEAVHLSFPEHRLRCIKSQLGLGLRNEEYPGQARDLESMIPYYNGGVVLSPWDSPLVQEWPQRSRIIMKSNVSSGPGTLKKLGDVCDQLGLSVCLTELQRNGHSFDTLEPHHHTTYFHLALKTLKWDQIQLYHDNPYSFYELSQTNNATILEKMLWAGLKRAIRWYRDEVLLSGQLRKHIIPKGIPNIIARQRFFATLFNTYIRELV